LPPRHLRLLSRRRSETPHARSLRYPAGRGHAPLALQTSYTSIPI
jgi:hypothetical protein